MRAPYPAFAAGLGRAALMLDIVDRKSIQALIRASASMIVFLSYAIRRSRSQRHRQACFRNDKMSRKIFAAFKVLQGVG
jgi:hypothetical protein